MTSKLFIAVGMPASGKSTFYHSLLGMGEWGFKVPAYLSTDKIREELYGDASLQIDHARVFATFYGRALRQLAHGEDVFLDATFIKRAWRYDALFVGQKMGAECIALFFDVPLWTAVRRDRKRSRHVGLKVLAKYKFGIEKPTRAEGFDYVYKVKEDGISYKFIEMR